MKKFYKLAAAVILAPALAIASANQAAAQRRNTTSHDVKPVDLTAVAGETASAPSRTVDNNGCNCGKDSKCMQKCGKMKKGFDKEGKDKKAAGKHCAKMEEKSRDIEEDYNKALRRIDKSSFNQAQKELLKKQAKQNRDLALKQNAELRQLMRQQSQERRDLDMRSMTDHKANRKALKSVSKIGTDD